MDESKNNDPELYYDPDKAVEYIFSRLPKELKSRIDREDIYDILDIETDYMKEVGIITDDDEDDDDEGDSDDDDGGGGRGGPIIEYDREYEEIDVMVN